MSTELKKAIGKTAADLVEPGMVIGLGTGSTSQCFIEHLIFRCKHGLKIHVVASSKHSENLASQGGIPLLDVNQISSLDLYIDGTDEIDPEKRMIKGGGGALIREKILATMSREMVVIFDESKLVPNLGKKHLLPIEVIPFGLKATHKSMEHIGITGHLRLTEKQTPYITDNGNYIIDGKIPHNLAPEEIESQLRAIPGVVGTGFFFHLAGRLVIGFNDGQVIIKEALAKPHF